MTQKERIFNRLKTGEWLSSVEASRDMYIMRLGARIFDLRAEGHNIIEWKVAGKNGRSPGNPTAEYKLIPAQAPVMPPAFKASPQKSAQQQSALL